MPRADCTASEGARPPRISSWRPARFRGDGDCTRRRRLGFAEMVSGPEDKAAPLTLREGARVASAWERWRFRFYLRVLINQESTSENLKSEPPCRRPERCDRFATGPACLRVFSALLHVA